MRKLFLLAASATCLFAQLPPPNDMGVSMGHNHMLVPDPEVHKKHRVGVLGAEEVHSGTLEAWKFPGIFLIVGKARTAPTGGTDGSTVNHIGVAVPSYAAIKAKMAELGIETATDIPASRQLIVNFPDKVSVEFIEDATLKAPAAFNHIQLSTPNDQKLRDWYVKTFGAKPATRRNVQVASIPGGELEFRKVPAAEAATKGRSLDHIGFEVKDLPAFCKKLEADGVMLEGPMRDAPQLGLKIAFLVDPEGTRIELTEGLAAAH
jgi:catechol 2,3-dioxygenase-like lactoylglutathione lyase family enzyme